MSLPHGASCMSHSAFTTRSISASASLKPTWVYVSSVTLTLAWPMM